MGRSERVRGGFTARLAETVRQGFPITDETALRALIGGEPADLTRS